MGIGDIIYSGASSGGSMNKPASIALGIVTDNWDAIHPGAVKVKIITENGNTVTSGWVPVVMPYAGSGAGLYAMPEVNSIVVLGYVDDNSISPVVIGSIWGKVSAGRISAKTKPPKGAPNSKNSKKVFATKSGHMLKFDESKDSPSIEIITAKKQRVFLDDKGEKILLQTGKSGNKVEIDGKGGNITIEAKKKITFKVGGGSALELSKEKTDVKNKTLNFDGTKLSLKGKQTKLEGSTVDIKSSGNLSVKSNGMAQIKGSMLKLN